MKTASQFVKNKTRQSNSKSWTITYGGEMETCIGIPLSESICRYPERDLPGNEVNLWECQPKAGCVLYRKLLCRELCKARKDSWVQAVKLGWAFLVSHVWGLWGWFLGRVFSKRSVPSDLNGAQRWLLLRADLMQAAGSEKHAASVLQCTAVSAEHRELLLHWLCSATQRLRGAKEGFEKLDVVLYQMMVTSLSVLLKAPVEF